MKPPDRWQGVFMLAGAIQGCVLSGDVTADFMRDCGGGSCLALLMLSPDERSMTLALRGTSHGTDWVFVECSASDAYPECDSQPWVESAPGLQLAEGTRVWRLATIVAPEGATVRAEFRGSATSTSCKRQDCSNTICCLPERLCAVEQSDVFSVGRGGFLKQSEPSLLPGGVSCR